MRATCRSLWLNGVLLFGGVRGDRPGGVGRRSTGSTPALGVALAFVLVSYFLEVLGSLWPDAAFLQPYSLFHYLEPGRALAGLPDATDFAVLARSSSSRIGYALVVFPRRDLAAPS